MTNYSTEPNGPLTYQTAASEMVNRSDEHLKMLSIAHFVLGGLTAVMGFFPVIYLIMGIVFVVSPPGGMGSGGPPAAMMGWFFICFAAFFMLYIWTHATLLLLSGLALRRRRRYMLCVVTACVACLLVPLGTILGVFSLVVLFRPGVKQMFS